MNQTRFGSLANTFGPMKERIESMGAGQALLLRGMAFYALAAQILEMFETTPDLQSVQLVHNCDFDVKQGQNTVVEATHSTWLFASEAGIHPDSSPEAHEKMVRELVPYTLMGNGTARVTRDDIRIERFLALDEFDHSSWRGIVAEVAHQLDMSFGTVRTTHSLI